MKSQKRKGVEKRMPKTWGTARIDVEIGYYQLSKITEDEISKTFGSDAFMKDNKLYRTYGYGPYEYDEYVRDLSETEVELFNSLHIVSKYFGQQYWKEKVNDYNFLKKECEKTND